MLSGRILPREQHLQPNYNLLQRDEPEMEFVYQVLDKALVSEPNERFRSAKEMLGEVDNAVLKIEKGAHVMDLNYRQACLFCVTGCYQVRVAYRPGQQYTQNSTPWEFWGSNGMDAKESLILACDTCGNVQMFRPDLTRSDSKWRNVR